MWLAPNDAKLLADRLLARSNANHCIIRISGGDSVNLRFARGNATTNGARSTLRVRVESHFGRRSGSASVTGLDEKALEEAVPRSEDMARSAPENPELMPPLGPQAAEFTVTARNKAGTWSGWAGVSETRFGRLDAARLGRRAIDKAAYTAQPVRLDPGKYTVILEPSAVSDLVGYMLWFMNARPADEGRSFFSRTGGGNKLGEKLFRDNVTIFSDPSDPIAPEPVFGDDGLPQRRTPWVENGVLRNLVYSRYWAELKGHAPVSPPRSFVMAGGTTSVDDMIRDTRRGVLVTRLWYIRLVDPQKLVLTGLTRDGNFLIEDGRSFQRKSHRHACQRSRHRSERANAGR